MPSKEYQWFIEHSEIEKKYIGEYIAILKDSIIAHGKDFKEVFKEAKKFSDTPFFHKVSSSDKDLVV